MFDDPSGGSLHSARLPAIILYLAASIAIVLCWRRFVQPMSRAAAIVIVLLPFCFCGRALLTGRVYAPIDMPFSSEPLKDYAHEYGMETPYNGTLSDLYMQMIPWQSAVRSALTRGEWPLLNPYMLCGSMLAANMQSAPYDPMHVVALVLSEAQALTFGAAITFFFAALFTFAFARSLGLGETASLIGAAGYMSCAILAFFVGWPLGRVWTFLPLVMLGVRMVVRETGVRAAVILTLGFVLMILAGHPESILHIVFTGAVWGVFELVQTRRWKSIALAAVCGVLALLICAISLLPFFSVAPETREYDVRHNAYANYPFRIDPHMVARRAGVSLFPFWGGQPERGNYTDEWEPTTMRVGAIVLALALAAVVVAPRRETWFFCGLAVFCAWAGLNAWPVAHVLHSLPLFDIALNERLVFPATFALTVLAAIAADRMRARGAIVIAAVAVLLLVGTMLIRDAQLAVGVDAKLLTFLACVDLIPLVLVAILFLIPKPRIVLPLLLGLILVQRTIEDGSIYPAHPEKAFYPELPVLQHMQKDGATPFRMVGLHYSFLPDAAALYELEDARGYEAMTFRRLADTYPLWSIPLGASFNNVPDMSRPFLSFLNVRYALGTHEIQPPDGWKVVMDDRNSRLFLNTRALPRAFVPRAIRYARDEADVLGQMAQATDFAETAWITVPQYEPQEIVNGPGSVAIRREGFDYTLDANMEGDGWVVISDAKWPGWRAYIDGRRVETHFANHAFIGVFVPKGKHTLRVAYMPEAFTRGRNITFVTLLAIAAFFALRNRFQQPRAV